jgi:hypothetical protein
MTESIQVKSLLRPLIQFGISLALLVILRICLERVALPLTFLPAANIVVSAAFIAIPVFALFRAAAYRWTWLTAGAFIAVGVALQFGTLALLPKFPAGSPIGLFVSVSQTGLLIWCLGLAAALSLAIRDRNMLVPMAIFLALFDIWLVFVPEGPVGQVARGNQTQLAQIAFTVPKPVAAPTMGAPTALAYIGPADFLFMAMFFCAICRFQLRYAATARWMAPVLAGYLAIALLTPNVSIGPIRLGALPALVPIAAVVMVVNFREFKLSRDEKQTTIALAIIGIAVLAWRFMVASQPKPPAPVDETMIEQEAPAGPLPLLGDPTSKIPLGTPAPGARNSQKYRPPQPPKGKPGPQ